MDNLIKALHEFEHPEVSQTDEWNRQRAIDPRNERWQNTMDHAVGSPRSLDEDL